MSGNISLTASMRSNLLSLQNISRTVGATQNKLATGNKVNSAIDNPSSYYTARSLNNRANDLDALLDSMGQAVSTIKTATTALETGATFLEQAAAVATSALEANTIPPKAFFEEKVGENGAVVTTAQELKDAVAAGKETICVYGQIDYKKSRIELKANQKLVGTEYYTGYTGKERFSQLKFEGSMTLYENAGISDLSIVASAEQTGNYYAIFSYNNNVISNITLDSSSTLSQQGEFTAGIIAFASVLELRGTIVVNNSSNVAEVHGIYGYRGATINSTADIYTNTIRMNASTFNVNSGTINLSDNLMGFNNSTTNIAAGATINENVDSLPVVKPEATKISSQQYTEILNQYDTLVKDSSYKGVNLLKNEKLNVRFNEKGNADLDVNGKDMSAGALGLNTVDWGNQSDIAQSLKEIAGALKSIRAFTAELGNNYSIITNRQEFTENLINILTEGADKLTLADMNEESANMLSLQTRQQLAINSLSLASQAAQAVLKLF